MYIYFNDVADILFLCKIILEKLYFKVETRLTCTNVIENIRKASPDLVLMDLYIPGSGGENARRLLRKEIGNKHVPVMVFSANAIETISKQVNANGFSKSLLT